jgi:hypothetical protein
MITEQCSFGKRRKHRDPWALLLGSSAAVGAVWRTARVLSPSGAARLGKVSVRGHKPLHADCQGISLRAKPIQEIGIRLRVKQFVKHILWILSRTYRHRLILRRVS